MQLEKQIQVCFDLFPELFQSRWEVLDFLFCRYGTGYEWENGEWVSVEEKYKHVSVTLPNDGKAKPNTAFAEQEVQKEFQRYKKDFGDFHDQYKGLGLDELAEQYSDEGLMKKAKSFVLDRRPYLSFSPLWEEASPLLNLPNDIQPDWLEGAKEIISLMQKANEVEFSEKYRDREIWIKARENNNKLIEGICLP